jgi:SPP1 gp7 family putative phage head morphogenesis protein
MDSQEYWKQREQRQQKHNIRNEQEYIARIREIYQNMLDEIQKEINGFYAKYATQEGLTLTEAKKNVSELDIKEYGRKAAKYVKEKNFSALANEEMRLYNATMKINRLELLKANIGLEMVSGFDELQQFFDVKLTERTLEEFKRQAGILGSTIIENAKEAHAIVNASFQNATYSDRVWMYQDMLKGEISELLATGLIRGRHPRQLAIHLKKRFGVSQYNAERLMITELARVQTEAQKLSFERNGYEEYQFHALGTACRVCSTLDQKHFPVKDMMPGENAPPMHPHCRCSTSVYMDREAFDRWLEAKNKSFAFTNIEIAKRKKPISEGIFETTNIANMDAIRPRTIANKMVRSGVGREALKYLQENNVKVNLVYGIDNPDNLYGFYDVIEDEITIYCDYTKTANRTAEIVIHEATHRMSGAKGTLEEEIKCFEAEQLHRMGKLTEKDKKDILKKVKELYPEL